MNYKSHRSICGIRTVNIPCALLKVTQQNEMLKNSLLHEHHVHVTSKMVVP